MAVAQLDTGNFVPAFAGKTLATGGGINGATSILTPATTAATTAAAAISTTVAQILSSTTAQAGTPQVTFASVATQTSATATAFSTSVGLQDSTYLCAVLLVPPLIQLQCLPTETMCVSGVYSVCFALYRAQFLIPYLQAHELSWPSFRYAYILWFILAGLLILWSILHAIFRGYGGVISAIMRKGGVRKFELGRSGKQEEPKPTTGIAAYGAPRQRIVHRAKYATPTVGQIFSCLLILATVFCVSWVGSDYLSPTECLFGGTCEAAVSQGPPKAPGSRLMARDVVDRDGVFMPLPANVARPRSLEEREADVEKRFGVYATQRLNPSGWAPFNDPLLAGTNTAISKSYWTSSARTGLIAYALVPLVVTLALRLWPFAIFATPFLTNYSFDKTAIFHRWIGRLIWALSTVHVGLWTKQLFIDTDPYGRYIWFEVWQYWRFVAGVVGYVALTAMIAVSFAPFRAKAYETFYYMHVALSIAFMVGCLLHFRVLQWWLIVGLALWGAERFTRFCAWLHMNGFTRGIGLIGRADRFMENSRKDFNEKRGPGLGYHYRQPTAQHSDMTLNDPYGYGASKGGSPMGSPNPSFYGQMPSTPNLSERKLDYGSELVTPPAGYAIAQLLPGRTIRLTFRAPVKMGWKPGQHCLVTIPKVSWWQSHPYTFANCDATTVGEPRNDMIFLIRARKGFSLALYKHVAALRRTHGPGVLVRTQVSFSMGSAGRAHWGEYKSILLVVGGTGVSFGLSVFDFVCRAMAARKAGKKINKDGRPFQTTQIHFLWILREWAHLAWVAPTLHRCLQISQPGSVRVSLYVATNGPPGIPMTPGTPGLNNTGYFFDAPPHRPPRPDELEGNQAVADSALDYVLFDGEDTNPTADEQVASSTVRRAGTMRRERNKRRSKVMEANAQHAADSQQEILYPPRPPGLGDAKRPSSPNERGTPKPSMPRSASNLSQSSQQQAPWTQVNSRRWSGASFGSELTLAPTYDDAYGGEMKFSRSVTSMTPLRERPQASPSASAVALSLAGDADEPLLDVVGADRESLDQIAELAVEGRPDLNKVFKDEITRSEGALMVGVCGPSSLSVLMRKMVADNINVGKIARGDQTGNIDIVVEDFNA